MFTLENFYKSKQWEALIASLKIERVNADGELICAHCGKPITKKYDCIAHHIVELTEENVNDFSVSLNPQLIELIHFRCHNVKHQRYEGFKQSVFLVYGSPCSGKSTWVQSVALEDDLIVDLDSIWEAICTSDRYSKPKRLRQNAFGVRDCLIDQIRTRTGNWRNAYVIGGYPLRTDRDRLCDLLKAEPIFIDETKEVCKSRAANDDWIFYIDDWFDSFMP